MTIQTMQQLKKEVKAIGMPWPKLQPLLPDWWKDVSDYPAGIVELRGFIAKYFGLEIDQTHGNLCLRDHSSVCFKTKISTDQRKLAPNRSLLTSVARQVALAATSPWAGGIPPAIALRDSILSSGRPWVGFEELVEVCWQYGVPVICSPELPFPYKMEGMAMFCLGRPVIALSKKPDKPGWALFTLAHEIGHLALDHLASEDGSALLDETISVDDTNNDDKECFASQYAVTLLTGGAEFKISDNIVSAKSMVQSATSKGREWKIDPAHLVLNAVHHTKSTGGKNYYPLMNDILDALNPGQTASSICRQLLHRYVDLTILPEESVAFLERIGLLK
ncbi:MAG: hypothetical protein HQM04_11930 [Magnetococcales bacterium]|nr:hypothetical protein [Magnetococcales bacterium]MBF0115733.1 hypothetical protein [Magnetococcales bacterium]